MVPEYVQDNGVLAKFRFNLCDVACYLCLAYEMLAERNYPYLTTNTMPLFTCVCSVESNKCSFW